MVEPIDDPVIPLVTLSPRLMRELASSAGTLRATVERTKTAVIVHVGGEVDACNETVWRRLLSEAVAATPPGATVVLDLSGLQFISCGALEAVLRHAQRSRQRQVDIRIVAAQEVIRRIIGDRALACAPPVLPSIEAALNHGADKDCASRADIETQIAALEAPVGAHTAASTRRYGDRKVRTRRSPWLTTVFDQLRQRRNRAPHVGYRTDHAGESASDPARPRVAPAVSQPTEPTSLAG